MSFPGEVVSFLRSFDAINGLDDPSSYLPESWATWRFVSLILVGDVTSKIRLRETAILTC